METKTSNLLPDPREVSGGNSTQVLLSITIGNGQIGGNIVTLGDTIIVKGDLSQPHLLGLYNDLKGKTIKVQTNVLDVNSMTNICIISTKITNDSGETLFFKMDQDEAPENGVITFVGNYKFI